MAGKSSRIASDSGGAHDRHLAMADPDRARSVSWAEPRHGLAVCGRARSLPQQPPRGPRLAHPHRVSATLLRSPSSSMPWSFSAWRSTRMCSAFSPACCSSPGVCSISSTGTGTTGMSGLTTGLFGLGVWSFVMATAHGAGAMLIPVLMPLEHAAMARSGRRARPPHAGDDLAMDRDTCGPRA